MNPFFPIFYYEKLKTLKIVRNMSVKVFLELENKTRPVIKNVYYNMTRRRTCKPKIARLGKSSNPFSGYPLLS